MRAIRRRLRTCAWLALLSIMALSVGPTVSRLLLPAGVAFMSGSASRSLYEQSIGDATASLHVMGSAHQYHDDMAIVAAKAPKPSHPPAHEHALEHCGLCLLAAHAFTFVQERPEVTAFAECTRAVLDRIARSVPRLRCDWSPASSRGPPSPGLIPWDANARPT